MSRAGQVLEFPDPVRVPRLQFLKLFANLTIPKEIQRRHIPGDLMQGAISSEVSPSDFVYPAECTILDGL